MVLGYPADVEPEVLRRLEQVQRARVDLRGCDLVDQAREDAETKRTLIPLGRAALVVNAVVRNRDVHGLSFPRANWPRATDAGNPIVYLHHSAHLEATGCVAYRRLRSDRSNAVRPLVV